MEELLYQYWFLANPDINMAKKVRLLEYFGDSFNIFYSSKTDLMDSGLLKKDAILKFIENKAKWDLHEEYEKFCHSPFSFVTIENEKYPEKLRNIFDPPYGLFYVGNLPDFSNTVSIVGARRCSAYGKKMAVELGRCLGEQGYTVISGMARGIDSHGHRGCLDGGGVTVAVLGCGCDVIYPKENNLLYEEIIKNGAVISEYQMGTAPLPQYFPLRNRIVSALSDIVIVVEAREKSGSLITADYALEQGKDIYAVPGRVGDALSSGCIRLIAQGAGIVVSAEDFIKEITGEEKHPIEKINDNNIKLTKEQMAVYDLFDAYPKSIATAIEESGMDYLKMLSNILSLERLGLLAEVFKNNYVR